MNEKGGDMGMEYSKYNYGLAEKIKDFNYEDKHEETFCFSPFGISEIQYLKRLIVSDQLNNDYKKKGRKALIDPNTTMYEFTERLLKKLNELENSLNKNSIIG
jgi:hypothetical protein